MGGLAKRRRGAKTVTLHFDDRRIAAEPGELLALTLLAEGVVATTRSIKYRRPRGPYCMTGDCGSCLCRVDGLPNIRICVTQAREGMRIQSQNVAFDRKLDPTGIVDRILRGGMDHHHFMVKPRVVNRVMQSVARGLTGLGTLPDRQPGPAATETAHAPDVLIIGAGPAGTAVREALRPTPWSVVWIDRVPPPRVRDDAFVPAAVFAAYPHEGVWAATGVGAHGQQLHTVRPTAVVLATGARDPMIPVPQNDLPGVVSARGLIRQVARHGASVHAPTVVIGDGSVAEQAAAALQAQRVSPTEVERIVGKSRVEAVRVAGKDIPCRLVAIADRPTPSYELAIHAGASVAFDGTGFSAPRDETGRIAASGPWPVWVAGDAAGYVGPRAAASDGTAIAGHVAAWLEARDA